MTEPPASSRSTRRSTRSSVRRTDSGTATGNVPPPPPPPPPPRGRGQHGQEEQNVEQEWSEVARPPNAAGESEVQPLLGGDSLAAAAAAAAVPPMPPPQPGAETHNAQSENAAAPSADAPPAPAVAETTEPAAATDGANAAAAAESPQHVPSNWTLKVRNQIRRQPRLDAPKRQQPMGQRNTSIIIQILVTPTMTEARLGRCIVQASSALSPDDRPAAGLFRERDGLFVPLETILAHPEEYKEDVWSLDPCLVQDDWKLDAQTRLVNLIKRWLVVGGVLVTSIVAYFILNDIQAWFHISLSFLWDLPPRIMRKLIDLPLREMYRYGPSVVGWEGQSLARICARITYHGDESFWSRNMDECQRIYSAKEEATLHMARPVVYAVLCYMLYQVLKSLVLLHAERRRWKPDSDMEQTYRAFNVLAGQMGRALAKKPYAER